MEELVHQVGRTTVLVDTSGGGQSTDFEVSLNSDGSGGSNSVSGTGNDVIYIYPTSTNSNSTKMNH